MHHPACQLGNSQKACQNLNSPVINLPASALANQSLSHSSTRAIDPRLTPLLRTPHDSIPLITTTQYTAMNTTAMAAYRIFATFTMSTRFLLWFSSSSHRSLVTPWPLIQRNRAVRSFTWRSTNTWKITCRNIMGVRVTGISDDSRFDLGDNLWVFLALLQRIFR